MKLEWPEREREVEAALRAAQAARLNAEATLRQAVEMVSAQIWEAAVPKLKAANVRLHEALLTLRDGPYRELLRLIDATVAALGPGLTDARSSVLSALRWLQLEPPPNGGRIEASVRWWDHNGWPTGGA